MSDSYLIALTRDPNEGGDTQRALGFTLSLTRTGADVVLWLVHNGVFAARELVTERLLGPLLRAGVRVLADDFSLRERGIADARLSPQLRAVPIDDVVVELAAGRKTLWV